MKIKKTYYIIFVFLVSALIFTTLIVVGAVNNRYDVFRIFGENEKNSVSVSTDIIAKGNDLSVAESEIAVCLLTRDATRNEAILAVLRRKALYAEAVRLGYKVSENRVKEQTEYEKNSIADMNAEQKAEFSAYLEELGITEDEYWISQYDEIKYELTVYDYLLPLKEEFAKSHAADNTSGDITKELTPEQYRLWTEEINRIADALIAEDNVRFF